MPEAGSAPKNKTPKGGRKGGKIFPHYSLKGALVWADKLVSKTHTAPQPVDVIRAGVVQAKSGVANMRISALRQYGLLQGGSAAINATDLARQIKSAPVEEKATYIKSAALRPDAFKKLFETFHGDAISIARIRQRSSEIGVHPDSAEKCAQLYVETVIFGGLAQREGDIITHHDAALLGEELQDSTNPADESLEDMNGLELDRPRTEAEERLPPPGNSARRGGAAIQININLDSSLDTEKLQKQLELLRRYGAL
jgi:hypothetical protein